MAPEKNSTSLNSGTILLVFVAVLAGLAGTYAIRVANRAPEVVEEPAPPKPKPKKVTVPLASRDIAVGTTLTIDDVALYKMSPEEVKKYSDGKSFMTNPSQIIGKIASGAIGEGETFTTEDFYPAGTRPNFAARLKPGHRAVTVTLSHDDALNGFATPGQSVDVLFHYDGSGATGSNGSASQTDPGSMFGHHDFNPPRRRDYHGNTIGGVGGSTFGQTLGDSAREATTTLVQAVEILAIGARAVPTDVAIKLPEEEWVSVTLSVSPRQAELLNVAKGHGRLSLTLRGDDDMQYVSLVDPVTIDEILDAEHTVHEMEIYRGGQLTRLQFDQGKFLRRKVFDDSAIVRDDANRAGNGQLPYQPHFPTVIPFWMPYNPAAMTGAPMTNSSAITKPTLKPLNVPSSSPNRNDAVTAPVMLYNGDLQ